MLNISYVHFLQGVQANTTPFQSETEGNKVGLSLVYKENLVPYPLELER